MPKATSFAPGLFIAVSCIPCAGKTRRLGGLTAAQAARQRVEGVLTLAGRGQAQIVVLAEREGPVARFGWWVPAFSLGGTIRPAEPDKK